MMFIAIAIGQVGYKVVPERKVKKPELGHLKKAGCPPLKHLREFKVSKRAVHGGRSQDGPRLGMHGMQGGMWWRHALAC